jgi:hypothetical protein
MAWLAGMLAPPACTVKDIEGGLTVICGDPAVPPMTIVKLAEAASAQASVAVRVKLNVPFETGVPTMERDRSELV